ncbi:hypothetical protein B0H63DRAFT_316767 [Podospora didyma]|uniref:Secreted protein n=1 Tax=Podospora didyma TaxID=330526 RepID=A0AAE0K5G2_9PEZI|nr:hypothetical protein B0H63DRAFT_316767 [Podospora didyma]
MPLVSILTLTLVECTCRSRRAEPIMFVIGPTDWFWKKTLSTTTMTTTITAAATQLQQITHNPRRRAKISLGASIPLSSSKKLPRKSAPRFFFPFFSHFFLKKKKTLSRPT